MEKLGDRREGHRMRDGEIEEREEWAGREDKEKSKNRFRK